MIVLDFTSPKQKNLPVYYLCEPTSLTATDLGEVDQSAKLQMKHFLV